jgi:hypothetical protein
MSIAPRRCFRRCRKGGRIPHLFSIMPGPWPAVAGSAPAISRGQTFSAAYARARGRRARPFRVESRPFNATTEEDEGSWTPVIVCSESSFGCLCRVAVGGLDNGCPQFHLLELNGKDDNLDRGDFRTFASTAGLKVGDMDAAIDTISGPDPAVHPECRDCGRLLRRDPELLVVCRLPAQLGFSYCIEGTLNEDRS